MLKILISAEEGEANGMPHFVASKKLAEFFECRGFIVFSPASPRFADEYAEFAEALVLSDGADIHVARFHGSGKSEIYTDYQPMMKLVTSRDDLEFALLKAFRRRGKPVLGIGRGANVIAADLFGIRADNVPGGYANGEFAAPPLFAAKSNTDLQNNALAAQFLELCKRQNAHNANFTAQTGGNAQ
jgi:gamma-glutamyl-gamma-aminobutyrate hydrolase PuuD